MTNQNNAAQAQRDRYHILKTDPEVFQAVLSGAKTFEIRLNDRGYAVGDVLGLRETKHTGAEMRAGAPLVYTGRECQRFVSHVLTGYGLADGWCCLSFRLPHAAGESTPVADERAAFARAITGRDDLEPHQVENVIGANDSRWKTWQDRAALASAPVAGPIRWPAMSPSKGQSPVLFEDGYAEGWAKCMDECRRAVSAASAPVADQREVAGVTLDGCLETLFRLGEYLGIDYADSRKQSGAPSGVYIKAIEDRVSQASNAAREEAAKLMDQTSRSSGAVLIRSLASAPVAGEAQPVCWIEKDVLESVRDEGSDAWVYWRPAGHAAEPDEVPLYAAPQANAEAFDFVAHLARQAEFSARTFGPGARVAGVCDHIRKELIEVETSGGDLKEWVDVIILGLDGAWRSGATPQEIIAAIVAKQAKNEARTWPDWRTVDPTKAIEHDRGGQP